MPTNPLDYVLYTENATGRGHPTLGDTANRVVRSILSRSGWDPDGDFYGFTGGSDRTYNAGAFAGATNEDKVQNAIDRAVLDGVEAVYVPASLLGYDGSGVTFDSSVRMTREGGNHSVWDLYAYGAKGDGATDDAVAVQAAITGAAAGGAGSQVSIPGGTFIIGTTLTLGTSGIAIVGSSGATLKSKTNLNTYLLDIAGTDGTNITDVVLENLVIDGNLANQSSPAGKITLRFSFTQRSSVRDCILLNGYDVACFVRHSQRFVFSRNHVIGWRGTALLVSKYKDTADTGTSPTQDVLVFGNYFNANSQQAVAGNGVLTQVYSDGTDTISTNRVNNVTVTGNAFVGVNDTAVEIGIGTTRAAVVGNTIDGAGNGLVGGASVSTGISADDAQFVTIASNTIGNYGGAADTLQDGIGIFRRASPLQTANISIIGNVISHAPRYGIAINDNCINVMIAGNVSIDAQKTGGGDLIIGTTGTTGIVVGINNFATAGANTVIGPKIPTGPQGTMTFVGGSVTVFATDSATSSGQALRTLAGSPAAIECIKGDASDYAPFRASTVYATADFDGTGGYRQTVDGWFQEDVAASQADVALTRLATTTEAPTRWIAVRAGSVTGVNVKSNAARSAGTLTIKVFKNGSVLGSLTAVLDGTNTTFKATTQAKDTSTFVAGDELELRVTTDGSWAPTTADIRASLEVET